MAKAAQKSEVTASQFIIKIIIHSIKINLLYILPNISMTYSLCVLQHF